MRALSVVFGCAVVLAIFLIVGRLAADRWAAALASLFVASDFALVRAGALGRMDGMCAAFGFGGLAAYLLLRERNVRLALIAGHALVAVSVFTHPNGGLYFLALTITALWWDHKRLRLSDAAAAVLPYVVLLALWGTYIAQEPGLFRQQFGGNTSRRFRGLAAPLTALWREISIRYLAGGQTPLRIVLLLPYLVGMGRASRSQPCGSSEEYVCCWC